MEKVVEVPQLGSTTQGSVREVDVETEPQTQVPMVRGEVGGSRSKVEGVTMVRVSLGNDVYKGVEKNDEMMMLKAKKRPKLQKKTFQLRYFEFFFLVVRFFFVCRELEGFLELIVDCKLWNGNKFLRKGRRRVMPRSQSSTESLVDFAEIPRDFPGDTVIAISEKPHPKCLLPGAARTSGAAGNICGGICMVFDSPPTSVLIKCNMV